MDGARIDDAPVGEPGHVRHKLERNVGGITCAECALDVVKPEGMPDYSRVGATRSVDVR